MNLVFVDSAAWIAAADDSDADYESSLKERIAVLEAGATLVTTDFVMDETLTLLRKRVGLPACARWWGEINGSPRLRWENVGQERFGRACEMFFRQRDKDYSITDCTSFIVMRELKIHDVLTSDHHFAQAGFRMLGPASGR